jgi:Lrp/AsnC family transcriptional regulator, leucine-responsive regulatory protein
MYNIKLDKIDYEILEILQENGRIKRNDLAEKVSLSLPSVSERLRKLEEEGYILSYCAKVNSQKLGYMITAFIFVTVDSSKHFQSFVTHCGDSNEIMECHAITGEGTHVLKVKTLNTASLEKLLAKIQSWAGVINTRTNVVLSSPKEDCSVKIIKPHQ